MEEAIRHKYPFLRYTDAVFFLIVTIYAIFNILIDKINPVIHIAISILGIIGSLGVIQKANITIIKNE